MKKPKVLNPDRVRKVPSRFSWVDHNLIRKGYLRHCDSASQGLYLFLVTVGDANGMSYYSDKSIGEHLNIALDQLSISRFQLVQLCLISYQKPYYQVLSLSRKESGLSSPKEKDAKTLQAILNEVMGGKVS